MKKLLIIIILSVLSTFYVKGQISKRAQITGFSILKCGCCWGWKIKMVDNNAFPNDTVFIAEKLPGLEVDNIINFGTGPLTGIKISNDTLKFPIAVLMEFYKDIECEKVIKVESMKFLE